MNSILDPLTRRSAYLTYWEFGGSYHEIAIDDVFYCGGEILVTVQALKGEPFVGGNKWPVHTNHTTIRLSEVIFEECNCFLPEQSCSVCRASSPDPKRSTI